MVSSIISLDERTISRRLSVCGLVISTFMQIAKFRMGQAFLCRAAARRRTKNIRCLETFTAIYMRFIEVGC